MNKNSSAFVFSVFAILMAVVAMYVATTRMSVGIPAAGAISDLTTATNPYYFSNSIFGVRVASSTATKAKVGVTGTQFTRVNGGTCYIKAYAATIAGSTTAQVDCQARADVWDVGSTTSPLMGVTYGDSIVATLGTSTAGTFEKGLVITGTAASSTAGHIVLFISNLTGATFRWPSTGAATGTASYIAVR